MFSLRVVALVLISFTFAVPAFADRSSKKAAADNNSVEMAPPQVLEKGDSVFGARLGTGSAWDGDMGLGANYEYMFHPNFGIDAQLDYATYSNSYTWGGLGTGKWSYTAWSFAVMGTFHFDAFKVQNLDTYVSLGLVHNFLSASWSSPGLANPGNADASNTEIALYANVRYFFNSHWGVVGSLGTGMGTIQIGGDYLF